ncbi:uncharacterized protein At5g01610-like isoform X2 [Henckelia pumila]|uniref:uncharacterized protein At5g01610-like isoform X2 n=1 Tax=Henckelia pumila TaxID=405737 RepID=UPI003C6E0A7E
MPSKYQRLGFSILSLIFFSAVAATSAAPTAYELLQSYDFPVGILPRGITHYDLDASSGRFDAYLNGSCSFSLEGSYQLKYNPRISGNIYKDRLTNLSGVSVKVLFLWFNIVEVRRNGENLEFSVGVASAEFPIDNFYVCPQCGCGLNCKSSEEKWRRGNLWKHLM